MACASDEWSARHLALAAKAAAACRALSALPGAPPPELLKRVDRLLGNVRDRDLLDIANDAALRRLENANQPIPTFNPTRAVPPTITDPRLSLPPADNSREVFKPHLKVKHHAIRPLNLRAIHDGEGIILAYENPYAYEIDAYEPPEAVIQSQESITYPPELKDTPCTFIDTADGLDRLVKRLNKSREFAVDLEHHSYRSYQGITCLIQISTDQEDYIVDVIKLREHAHVLNEPFTDPKILKVFHGADSDVKWLQRDFGVYVVGLFDTHRAAIALQHSSKSLQAALQRYCDITVDKSLRLSDWRVRPLNQDLIEYARSDTHYLLYLWRRMKQDLLADSAKSLMNVFEESKRVAAMIYEKPFFDDGAYLNLIYKTKKVFEPKQTEAIRLLFKWRDEIARAHDESPGYVLPNHMLLQISMLLPREPSGILACCTPTPPLLIQNLETVYRFIVQASTMTSHAIVADTAPKLPTLTAYSAIVDDRQTFDQETIPPFAERIPKLPKTPQRRSMLTTDDGEAPQCDLESITASFVTPYERYESIMKYLLVRDKKLIEKPVAAPKIDAIPEKLAPPSIEPGEEDAIVFIPRKRKAEGPKPPTKEETEFKSFDYKNYNFDKFENKPKKKRKFGRRDL